MLHPSVARNARSPLRVGALGLSIMVLALVASCSRPLPVPGAYSATRTTPKISFPRNDLQAFENCQKSVSAGLFPRNDRYVLAVEDWYRTLLLRDRCNTQSLVRLSAPNVSNGVLSNFEFWRVAYPECFPQLDRLRNRFLTDMNLLHHWSGGPGPELCDLERSLYEMEADAQELEYDTRRLQRGSSTGSGY